MNLTLVYPVAGLSSRFNYEMKWLTKVGPNDESLIEYSIKQALPAGFTEIIFIVGDKTEQSFRDAFGNNYQWVVEEGTNLGGRVGQSPPNSRKVISIPIKYTKQTFNPETRDKPWGTSDAICTVLPILNNPCIFCNGDDIYSTEAFQTLTNHLKNNPEENAAIGYQLENTFKEQTKGNRGMFTTDQDNFVQKIVETYDIEKNNYHKQNLTAQDPCSMNIWALTPQTIQHLNQQLQEFKQANQDNRTAECLLPNELSNLCQKNLAKIKLYPTTTTTIGLTYPEDVEKMRQAIANQNT